MAIAPTHLLCQMQANSFLAESLSPERKRKFGRRLFTSSKKREIRHFSRRRPRGGQSGRDRRRRKFSGTDERAPGMLLLSKQFHDSFECLSLNRRSAKQNKTKRKVRFPYNPIHLLRIHVSTLFILTLFVRKSMKLLHNSMHIKCMGLNRRLTIQTR